MLLLRIIQAFRETWDEYCAKRQQEQKQSVDTELFIEESRNELTNTRVKATHAEARYLEAKRKMIEAQIQGGGDKS